MSDNSVVTIKIPDIEHMRDEELAHLAPENDGRWSEQTKALLKQFNTSKLDLNLAWSKTPVTWHCPCCDRCKAEIARLSRSGVLRCKLEWHHDHLSDFAQRFFDDLNPLNPDDVDYNRQRDITRHAIVSLTTRFAPTLICADCNSAEASAKSSIPDVDEYFTFSPREIMRFIRPSANGTPVIEWNLARQIWENAKADFYDRIDFSKRMAKRVSNGKHRKEILHVRADQSFEDRSYYRDRLSEASPIIAKRHLVTLLEQRSVAYDGDGNFSIRKPVPTESGPTEDEFRLLERRMVNDKKLWIKVGDLWKCGCCDRSKREICRRSNKGDWTARIHKIPDWELETNTASLSWRYPSESTTLIIGSHRMVYICQDCRSVETKLLGLHPDIPKVVLTPQDIFATLRQVNIHTEHDVDYDEALRITTANRELGLAVTDYNRHFQMSLDTKYQFVRQVKYGRKSRRDALEDIAQNLFLNAQTPFENILAYAEWLVEEGQRFQQLLAEEKI
ncbi:hypothetical protein V6582_14955 [Agrobacterium vitis]|uniref:hypothetical protein n=1 Tax=Agrobacterium vitis TaxID=373 RepID=UPI0012E862EC|nr:hypothetical protein [Agrobacterium vitis]MVA27042.1 hypothetical protein [Agrobacterium vitis]